VTWELFWGGLLTAPILVFAAAVLLDHALHGPNRPDDQEDE